MTKKKKTPKIVDTPSGRPTSPSKSIDSVAPVQAEAAVAPVITTPAVAVPAAVVPVVAASAVVTPAVATSAEPNQQPEFVWMEIEEAALEQLTLREPGITMAQAQLELESRLKAKRLMSQLLKDDLDEPEEDYPPEKTQSPYVNKSFFKKSGCLIRIFNQDIPGVPEEIGVMRLEVGKPANIPAVLYKEKGKLKSWAIGQLKGALKESGHNCIEDSRLTPEEFTARFSVTSLSDYGRKVLGTKEPGLWALHAPTLIEPVVACRYEDGSEDSFILLRMYVNLVRPEFRTRKPPGGWIPATVSDSEIEKRKVPAAGRQTHRPTDKRPRPSYEEQQEAMSKLAVTSAVAVLKEANVLATYPALPATKNPAGMVTWPENDVPKISKKL